MNEERTLNRKDCRAAQEIERAVKVLLRGEGQCKALAEHDTWRAKHAIALDTLMVNLMTERACKGDATWATVARWEQQLSEDVDRAIELRRRHE